MDGCRDGLVKVGVEGDPYEGEVREAIVSSDCEDLS